MSVIYLLLLLGAVVCFAVAAFVRTQPTQPTRINLVALGLLLWVLVPALQALLHLDA